MHLFLLVLVMLGRSGQENGQEFQIRIRILSTLRDFNPQSRKIDRILK